MLVKPKLGDDVLQTDIDQTEAINAIKDYVVELISTPSETIRKWNSGVLEIDGVYEGVPVGGSLVIPVGATIFNPSVSRLPVISPYYNSTTHITLVVAAPTVNTLRCVLTNTQTNTPITVGQRVSYHYVGRWK